jgi:hypothetical protein
MQRQASNWWLVLLWIPVLALVLGLLAGCAATGAGGATAPVQPTRADLRRLIAQELDVNSRFDSFAAAENADARRIAAIFRPVVEDVNPINCRAAPAESLDCKLEVILVFPAMDGRESRTYWERRLRQVGGDWQLVGQHQP